MNRLLLLSFILLTSLNASLIDNLKQKPDELGMLNQIKKTEEILFTLSQALENLAPNSPERTDLEEKKAVVETKLRNYITLCNNYLKNTTPLDKEEEEIESGSDEEYEIDSSSTSEEEDYADLDGDRKEPCLPRKKLEPKKQAKPHLFPVEPKEPGAPRYYNDLFKKNIHWCTLNLPAQKATPSTKVSNSPLNQELTALFLQLPLKHIKAKYPSEASLSSKSMINLLENISNEDLEKMRANQKEWDARQESAESEEKKCSSGIVSL